MENNGKVIFGVGQKLNCMLHCVGPTLRQVVLAYLVARQERGARRIGKKGGEEQAMRYGEERSVA